MRIYTVRFDAWYVRKGSGSPDERRSISIGASTMEQAIRKVRDYAKGDDIKAYRVVDCTLTLESEI